MVSLGRFTMIKGMMGLDDGTRNGSQKMEHLGTLTEETCLTDFQPLTHIISNSSRELAPAEKENDD